MTLIPRNWRRRVVQVILILLLVAFVLFTVAWLIATVIFAGADHSRYDQPRPASTTRRSAESEKHAAASDAIAKRLADAPPKKGQPLLQLMREDMNERGESAMIVSDVREVDAAGLKAEWVIAPNATPSRRLLFIHGGGYMLGSPRSHRPITSRLSEVSSSAVLAIDYRLMPENSRMAGIEDCRKAYDWILNNGPCGLLAANTLIVAGDSSGGNLALTTVAWARDTNRRPADAVVALCPQTDATLASPSLVRNVETDVMQGVILGPVVKAPQMFALWGAFLMHKMNPSSPLMSPLLGNLSRLPPTLLQASESEMFLDDSIRYANKAKAHGSIAEIQTWPHTMHVWHAFDVPEATEAFQQIGKFLETHAPVGTSAEN